MIISNKVFSLIPILEKGDASDFKRTVFISGVNHVAMDGKVLVVLKDNTLMQGNLFENQVDDLPDSVLITKESLERMSKTREKPKNDAVIKNIIAKKSDKDGYIFLRVPGNDEEEVLIRQKQLEIVYPPLDKVNEKKGELEHEIIFDYRFLSKLCEMFKKLSPNYKGIKFKFYKDTTAVFYENIGTDIEVEGIIMPMVEEKDEEKNTEESDSTDVVPQGEVFDQPPASEDDDDFPPLLKNEANEETQETA